MFGFGRKKKHLETTASNAETPLTEKISDKAREGLMRRLKQRLARTRGNLTDGLAMLVLGKKRIDEDLLEELETLMLLAD